jgi:RNA polymerase sigma factor (TIGR02999 family)
MAVPTDPMPPDPRSIARVTAQLHDLLREAARSQRRALGAGETMSTTALVNEAWLRLRQSAPSEFADRRHFVAIAARAMRNVLVDYARERGAAKRGGGAAALDLDEHDVGDASETLVLEVADALDRLEAVRPRLADVVYLRYFGGLSDAEVGDVLGIEESTVRRDWQKARGWLYGALQP